MIKRKAKENSFKALLEAIKDVDDLTFTQENGGLKKLFLESAFLGKP